jgi:hypothetical protein
MRERILMALQLALVCVSGVQATAQDTFQNLNFEQAHVTPSPIENWPHFVGVRSALPGWTAYLGNSPQAYVGYNAPSANMADVSILGPNWSSLYTLTSGLGIIDGNYSILLQAGLLDPYFGESVSIAQRGTVPSTARSLQFAVSAGGALAVSFAGNALDPVPLSSGQSPDGARYTWYGASISAWAGHTGELEFTSVFGGAPYPEVLDDISFSTQAIPDKPSTLSLTGVVAFVFALYRCFVPKRRIPGRLTSAIRCHCSTF